MYNQNVKFLDLKKVAGKSKIFKPTFITLPPSPRIECGNLWHQTETIPGFRLMVTVA